MVSSKSKVKTRLSKNKSAVKSSIKDQSSVCCGVMYESVHDYSSYALFIRHVLRKYKFASIEIAEKSLVIYETILFVFVLLKNFSKKDIDRLFKYANILIRYLFSYLTFLTRSKVVKFVSVAYNIVKIISNIQFKIIFTLASLAKAADPLSSTLIEKLNKSFYFSFSDKLNKYRLDFGEIIIKIARPILIIKYSVLSLISKYLNLTPSDVRLKIEIEKGDCKTTLLDFYRTLQLLMLSILMVEGLILIAGTYYKNVYRNKILSFSQSPVYASIDKKVRYEPKNINIKSIKRELLLEKGFIVDNVWKISEENASFLGSASYPGEGGNVIIYGHNKSEIFGLLVNIKLGDEIEIVSADYKTYRYVVSEILTVNPSDVEVIQPTNSEVLTLYTCIGLLDSKRLIIKAVPAD